MTTYTLGKRPKMTAWKIHSKTKGYLVGSRPNPDGITMGPVFSKSKKEHEVWYVSAGAQRRLRWCQQSCPNAKLKPVKV